MFRSFKIYWFKEILDGRVKTLHPKIHAGILSIRKNKSHIKDLKKNNFERNRSCHCKFLSF